jgi:hypothetical protein
VDAEVAGVQEADAGVAVPAAVEGGGAVVLEVAGAEEDEGLATTEVAPRPTRRSIAVSRSGAANSMNPQPTASAGACLVTASARAQYSATPSAERLPCPTSSRAGRSVTVSSSDRRRPGGRWR